MIIEGVVSFISMIGIAYLLWYLHKTGKQIQRQQRDLEANRAKTLSSKSDRFGE
jgi:hypothetical protein